jgi:hypothetical protein
MDLVVGRVGEGGPCAPEPVCPTWEPVRRLASENTVWLTPGCTVGATVGRRGPNEWVAEIGASSLWIELPG